MKSKNYEQYKRLFKLAEILLTLDMAGGLFALFWYYYFNGLMRQSFDGKGNLLMIVVYVLIAFLFLKIYGGFEIGFYKSINAVLSQVLALICTNIVVGVQLTLMIGSLYLVGPIFMRLLLLSVVQGIGSIIVVFLFSRWHTALFPAWQMLLIYEKDSVKRFLGKINARKDKYIIKDSMEAGENVIKEIRKRKKEFDAVLIYDVSSEYRNDILKFCYGEGIRVYQTPKISDILVRSAEDHHLFDTPLLMSRNIGLSFEQKLVKRIFDVILSMLMLCVASPFMLIAALCIKAYDGGPVLFKQKRITQNNREFVIFKFRSMIVDAEADGKARAATKDDDRITPIGKIIRKTRIDELPQLINVLNGDMSLVGPRPERVENVEEYSEKIPEFKYRTKVKGGLTGYAQVYGKYNTTAYDKLKLDLMYIEHYSLALDLRIMIMTVKTLFMKSSTEGFETGNVTEEQ